VNKEALAHWGRGGVVAPKNKQTSIETTAVFKARKGVIRRFCRVKKLWESQVQENLSIMSLTFFSLLGKSHSPN
jgi:hypothetical protein